MFKDHKFYFWSGDEIQKGCEEVEVSLSTNKMKDECAEMNDHIFGKYHEQQMKVLA